MRKILLIMFLSLFSSCNFYYSIVDEKIYWLLSNDPSFAVKPVAKSEINSEILYTAINDLCTPKIYNNEQKKYSIVINKELEVSISKPDSVDRFVLEDLIEKYGTDSGCEKITKCLFNDLMKYIENGVFPYSAIYDALKNPERYNHIKVYRINLYLSEKINILLNNCFQL